MYADAGVKQGLSKALRSWRELSGRSRSGEMESASRPQGPSIGLLPESEELKQLHQAFLDYDADEDGRLSWVAGEVRGFLRRAFEARQLPPPPLSTKAWSMVYHDFDCMQSDCSMLFDFGRGMAFLVCLAEALLLGATGQLSPLEVDRGEFVLRRSRGCGSRPSATNTECQATQDAVILTPVASQTQAVPEINEADEEVDPQTRAIERLSEMMQAIRDKHKMQELESQADLERRERELARRSAWRQQRLQSGDKNPFATFGASPRISPRMGAYTSISQPVSRNGSPIQPFRSISPIIKLRDPEPES